MRKLFAFGLAILLAAALAAPANAGKLLRQNADGTASWVNTRDDTITPAGEHAFVVEFSDIATAATRYITIPFAGRLKEANIVLSDAIGTATEIIEFYISSPASAGGFFNQFTPVTPAIAEAATTNYELRVPLAYAATGQRATVDWPVNSNTSLEFGADDVIAIHTVGDSAANTGATSMGGVNATITIIVH